MSKARLKKTLKSMSQEELVEVICEIYDARKEAKEYFEYWLDPQPEKLVETVKKKLLKLFFISEKTPRKSPAMADVKRVIADFRTLCFEADKTADVLLYAFETYVQWLESRRKVMSHQEKAGRSRDTAEEYIAAYKLEPFFGIRLERAKERFDAVMRRGDLRAYSRRRWFGY